MGSTSSKGLQTKEGWAVPLARSISRSLTMSLTRQSAYSSKLRPYLKPSESFHVVSLTSSTYGVLTRIGTPDPRELYGPCDLSSIPDLAQYSSTKDGLSRQKQDILDAWELMGSVEDVKEGFLDSYEPPRRPKCTKLLSKSVSLSDVPSVRRFELSRKDADKKSEGKVHEKDKEKDSEVVSQATFHEQVHKTDDNCSLKSTRGNSSYCTTLENFDSSSVVSDAESPLLMNRVDDDWCVVGSEISDHAAKEVLFDAQNFPVPLQSSGVAKKARILAPTLSSKLLYQEKEPAPRLLKKNSSCKVSAFEFEEKLFKASKLENYEYRCPPDGENAVVFYSTSLGGIRKTFNDCNRLRMILKGHCVKIDERDISIDAGFKEELKNIMGKSATVPRLFIRGRYIGGADEVQQLNDDNVLQKLLIGLPKKMSTKACDGCDGMRFIPCIECSGSRKIIDDYGKVLRCSDCNENGLMRCPLCH